MRKKLRVSILLLTIATAAWMFAGCGDRGQGDVVEQTEEEQQEGMQGQSEDDSSDMEADEDGNQDTDNDAPAGEDIEKSADTSIGDASNTSTGESAELCVDVESIGDNSVVGNKIFIETTPDRNGEIMLVGAGGDNQVLVTVYFEENASYVYETIRNGGADVETREGSFSDIGLDMILDLTGYYKGEDFYADKVKISNVILD